MVIERDLNDLALVFEICGPRFELQNLAWGLLKDVRRVWSCWMINSFHEAGCVVRALTQLKRSDSTFFTALSNLIVRESQKIGRKVHKRGLEIAKMILYNTRYNEELMSSSRIKSDTSRSSPKSNASKEKSHSPASSINSSMRSSKLDDEEESIFIDRIVDPNTVDLTKPFNVEKVFDAFTEKTDQDELWDICKEVFRYVFYKDPYWEKPESFRKTMYLIFLKNAIRVWLQIANEELTELGNERKKKEEEERLKEEEKRKKLFEMLEMERKGIARDEDWDKEEEEEVDVVQKYINEHKREWKQLYEKEGRIPKSMKDFYKQHNLSKTKAKKLLGISKNKIVKSGISASQRTAKILGYDATEQLIWEHRIQPPGGRYETVAASYYTLCEYTGMQLKSHFVQRAEDQTMKKEVHEVFEETE